MEIVLNILFLNQTSPILCKQFSCKQKKRLPYFRLQKRWQFLENYKTTNNMQSLQNLRAQLGLYQIQFSDLLAISSRLIALTETGKRPLPECR